MVTLTLGDELDEGVEENQDLRMTHRCQGWVTGWVVVPTHQLESTWYSSVFRGFELKVIVRHYIIDINRNLDLWLRDPQERLELKNKCVDHKHKKYSYNTERLFGDS